MKLTRWPNYHGGGGRDFTKPGMSPLSVSTSSDVCKHLSAFLIARFYQVPLRVEHLYVYCVKSRIHRTYLDGKEKFDFVILKPLRLVVGCLQDFNNVLLILYPGVRGRFLILLTTSSIEWR